MTDTSDAMVTRSSTPGSRLRRVVAGAALAGGVALSGTGCLAAHVPPPPSPVDSAEAREDLNRVFTAYWREMLPRRPRLAAAFGQRVDAVPSPALAESEDNRTRYVSQRLGRALDRVDAEALGPRDYASLQTLRWELDLQAEGASQGANDFSLISTGESSLRDGLEVLLDHPFTSAGDLDRYLYLLDGLGLWMTDVRAVLGERQEKGLVANVEAVDDFRRWLGALRVLIADSALAVAPTRLRAVDTLLATAFRLQEAEGLRERVLPALDSLETWLGAYREHALERPGLWQYPGGKEHYRYQLRRRSGLEVEPEEAHQAALSQLRRVDSLIRLVQPRIAGRGPLNLDSLRALPEVAPRAPEAIVSEFQQVLAGIRDTLATRVAGLPDSVPRVRVATPMERFLHPEGVVRPPEYLDSATEIVVTPWWGSTTSQLQGPARYFALGWPGRGLAEGQAYAGGSLNPIVVMHPSRSAAEGWAAYATQLAGEMGYYREPLAMWQQLMNEGLRAAWLLVDTGVHYYGWSRAQGIATLRPFSTATPQELDSLFVARVIQSPGGAGAAALGAREYAAMRAWMQRLLGKDFNMAMWHQEVLSLGPLPLPVLAAHLEWWGWDLRRRIAQRDAMNRPKK